MLYQINCKKFHQQTITFHNNLNIVLGDNTGTNSIGKSTLLMIIDFVYGGNDYLEKCESTIQVIGHHVINFSFIFDSELFYFARDTSKPEIIQICDNNFMPSEEISLDDYIRFLSKKYNLNNQEISFRNFIGRFSRIYGKENLNEKRPLDIVFKEAPKNAINAVLKIFNLYNKIEEVDRQLKQAQEEKSVFKKAIEHSIIGRILTSKELKKYEEDKKDLEIQLENIRKELLLGITNKEDIKAEEILNLRNELDFFTRKKTKLSTRLKLMENIQNESQLITETELSKLRFFFPTANIKSISEIEIFHKDLIKILQKEIETENTKQQKLLSTVESEISTILTKLEKVDKTPAVETIVLDKYVELENALRELKLAKDRTDQKKKYDEQVENFTTQFSKIHKDVLSELSVKLNNEFNKINDIIYNKKKKPPIIFFTDSNYEFKISEDGGTGTNFKNLIIYDLVIFELTYLPILIHDSYLLKQIADEAIERIFEIYMNSKKQVFIAFDKASSYTEKTQKIIEDNFVIKLSGNGEELFGQSWANKK